MATKLPVPAYVEALLRDIVRRMENRTDPLFKSSAGFREWSCAFGGSPIREDRSPIFPEITWRAYDFNGENDLPNFTFAGVSFWWRKYPFLDLTTDAEMPAAEWVQWYDRCVEHIEKVEREAGGSE